MLLSKLQQQQRHRSSSRQGSRHGRSRSPVGSVYYPVMGGGKPPTPPLGHMPQQRRPNHSQTPLSNMMGQFNSRLQRSNTITSSHSAAAAAASVTGILGGRMSSASSTRDISGRSMRERGHISVPSTNSLRAFKLRGHIEREHIPPTF